MLIHLIKMLKTTALRIPVLSPMTVLTKPFAIYLRGSDETRSVLQGMAVADPSFALLHFKLNQSILIFSWIIWKSSPLKMSIHLLFGFQIINLLFVSTIEMNKSHWLHDCCSSFDFESRKIKQNSFGWPKSTSTYSAQFNPRLPYYLWTGCKE